MLVLREIGGGLIPAAWLGSAWGLPLGRPPTRPERRGIKLKRDRVAEVHFYEWRIGAWALSETRDRLDATGRGIYRELLDHCYGQGKIPDDQDWMCRRCACTMEQLAKCWPVLARHFPKIAGTEYRSNVYADMFRAQYSAYCERQRSARASRERKANQTKEMRYGGATTSGFVVNLRQNNIIQNKTTSTSTSAPPMPMLQAQTEYPLTFAAIQRHDPAVDVFFVQRLAQTCCQAALSNPAFDQACLGDITDESIARAVVESFNTGPKRHGTGLLLSRVPNILAAWTQE